MNPLEAGEHLRMVDGIIRSADRTVRVPPLILIGVGIVCAAVTGTIQAQVLGWSVPAAKYLQPVGWAIMFAVIAVALWRARGSRRETLLDAYTGRAFLVATMFQLVLNLTAQHRVIPAAGMGLVWAGSYSMALMIVGAMGSRILLGGGAAMLVAVGAAGFMGRWLPATLAIAWIVGFVIPGLVLATKKNG
jgi:hypothetical protein